MPPARIYGDSDGGQAAKEGAVARFALEGEGREARREGKGGRGSRMRMDAAMVNGKKGWREGSP